MMPVDAGLPILSTDNLNVVQHEIAITSPNGTSRRASITSHRRNSSSRRSQTPKARPFATSVPGQQITAKRPVFAASDADGLVHAGTARANIAASVEHPDGTTEDDFARRYEHLTVSLKRQFSFHYPTFSKLRIFHADTPRSSNNIVSTGIRTAMVLYIPGIPTMAAVPGDGISFSASSPPPSSTAACHTPPVPPGFLTPSCASGSLESRTHATAVTRKPMMARVASALSNLRISLPNMIAKAAVD